MSQNQILLKRTAIANSVPTVSDVMLGELTINTTDGILYTKKSASGLESIISFKDSTLFALNSGSSDTVAFADDVKGGSAGSVLYQDGANSTAFTGVGSSGQFLQSTGGGAPVWATIPSPDFSPYYLTAGGAISGAVTMGSTLAVTGAVTMSSTLNVTGAIYCNADITAFSDERLKDNIESISGALDSLLKVRGTTYTWKESKYVSEDRVGVKDYGVIAQEIQQVFPEMVHDNGEVLSVAYNKLIPVMIEAIRELSAEVAELKKKLN